MSLLFFLACLLLLAAGHPYVAFWLMALAWADS